MHLTNNVGYLIQHLAFTMSRQNDQLLQERLGIGFSQFKILMVLERSPHLQQKQIAEALGQTEASISRQIRLMSADGLLQSTVSPRNRREHITAPTNKGIRLAEEAALALNSYHAPMFERMSEHQLALLREALMNMHECVCQAGKTGACDHPFSA
jgi:DNA-binding MarR family transcriptional regulator